MEDACVVRCFNKISQKGSLHIKWLIFGITSGVVNTIALMLRTYMHCLSLMSRPACPGFEPWWTSDSARLAC